jgi:diguanylate cyclase (GGDEF)-like protein
MAVLGMFDFWSIHLPAPVAIALVATLGYFVGRRNRTTADAAAARSRRDLRRAQAVARELEKIAWIVRHNLAKHHASLSRFKQRVSQVGAREEDTAWTDLCREASEMLTPTLRLANQISSAYDEIRQQCSHLMAFTESRTDSLTGTSNRRGLDDSLAAQLALMNRYEVGFSVAIFDIDHFKHVNDEHGHLQGDRVLQKVAKLLEELARETDLVARFGGEEFLVVMPRTDLEGACVFAERVRAVVEIELSVTVSGGVAAAMDGDTPDSLLSRADAALYQAKTNGRNRVCRHDGAFVEPMADVAAVPQLA